MGRCFGASIAAIIGFVIGGVIGYALGGKSPVPAMFLGALIGGVVVGLFALLPAGVLEGISGLFDLAECCSIFAVFGVTTVMILSTFLIGHSLLVAVLAGVSTMTVLLVALSAAASLQHVR